VFTAARRSAFALLLHGNAPCGHRCGRQCDRVEDQPETPRRSRDCEGHSRQRQGPVAHVHRGSSAEGGAPVRSDGPAADLTFHGDVLPAPRREVPTTARHRDARASLKCLPSDGGECWVTGAPAARAGKAILLEKPLAARPRDARRISRAVRRTGVPAMIAHTPRFDPRVRARLREVRKLGPVRAVHVIQHLPSRGVRWESERPHGPPALARRGGCRWRRRSSGVERPTPPA